MQIIAQNRNSNLTKTIVIAMFCGVILFLSKNIGFFWDNVLLCSKMGHYLYNNNLFTLNFPESFDPGHPPTMAFIQALGWKILGKTLFVSHLIMLPFLFGLVWQLHNFISYFTKNKGHQIAAIAFVFCDPTILAQCFYIGQEVPQLFFFLLALNQLLKGNYILKCVALFCLSICSVRGMMLCGGFFIFEVFYYANTFKNIRQIFAKKNIMCYVVASSAAVAFIIWRITEKGYFLIHKNSQWGNLAEIVDFKGLMFNIKVIIHRFLDFGRIAVVIFLIAILYINKKVVFKNDKIKLLLAAAILSTSIITIVSLAATNTIGHRYFALSFLFLHLLALYILQTFFTHKKTILFVILSIVLITGNLWQYPTKYAQGWDASLRSLPYFNLRNQAIHYLHNNNISANSVGTFFPNIYSNEEINLNGDTASFVAFDSINNYVLYANIYNQKPQQYQYILNNYTPIKHFENFGIWVEVLKKK